jgi:hypothetical protein
MTKFIGQVSTKPERRDGRLYFSIWNTRTNEGINCISSVRFEVDNKDVPLDLKPLDTVEVIGEVRMQGTCFFDSVNVVVNRPNCDSTS